ncbi:MAG: hypothetical protein BWZ06_01484 [Bacteroidetes bacterium ADurb.BinA261]|nr:MAG: hypothetical protein BWZ06_01484 [Bacteroidetes bacterium ADurb.BinA261]
MKINFYAAKFEFVLEGHCRRLTGEPGDDYRRYINAVPLEIVDALEYIHIVGNAEIGADFVAFDVAGINAHDDIHFVLQALQQLHLDIGRKPGKHACSMIIV